MILDEQAPQSDQAVEHAWWNEFVPHRWLRNSHAQTLVGNFLPRPAFTLASHAEQVVVDPADNSRVLCHCHWQPEAVRRDRLTLILIHGLEGSSDSRYVQGNTQRAWSAGWNVIRMNMRNCGDTEQLTPTLYHSGLSQDVCAVMRWAAEEQGMRSIAIAGYSMGGNMALKLAGELGDQAPDYLRAVIGVSPAADLGPSADALHVGANRIYEWKFLRGLMARFRRKAELFPDIYGARAARIFSKSADRLRVQSIRNFDEYVMTPYFDFTGADDYYVRGSAGRLADRIRVPALVLHALDDPFIRLVPETRERMLSNPNVTLIESAHGGHCAFLDAGIDEEPTRYAGHWAERTIFSYLSRVLA